MRTDLGKGVSVLDTGATMVGLLSTDSGVVLIDSGSGKSQAKELDKMIGAPVEAVLHTHTHADHIGGSAYFQNKYKSKIYIPAGELSFAVSTELEGSLLFGGASPEPLQNRFIMAQKTEAEVLTNGLFDLCALATYGHSPAHTSFLTGDILFIGDAILAPEVTEKHKLLYFYDALRSLDALDIIGGTEFQTAVLCHHGIFDRKDILSFIDAQKEHVAKAKMAVLKHCNNKSAEEICADIAAELDLRQEPSAWYLALSTVKGYLSGLLKEKCVSVFYEQGLKWARL